MVLILHLPLCHPLKDIDCGRQREARVAGSEVSDCKREGRIWPSGTSGCLGLLRILLAVDVEFDCVFNFLSLEFIETKRGYVSLLRGSDHG